MEILVNELKPSEYKRHVKTSRACKLNGNSYIMDSKFGMLNIDFSNYNDATRCVIISRRQSGNGKVVILSGKNVLETDVLSKSKQFLNINLDENRVLQIKRPNTSTGAIEILDIILYKDMENLTFNWAKILKSCKYSDVKITEGKLHAIEGAFIKAEKINAIETVPKNAFIIKDNNTIKFLYACEVISLDLNKLNLPSVNFANLKTDILINKLVKSGEQAPSILSAQPLVKQNINTSSNIVFDSNNYDFSNTEIFLYNEWSKIINKEIWLDHKGKLKIIIPGLKKHSDYALSLEVSRDNGNGKISAGIFESKIKHEMQIAWPQGKNLNFNICNQDEYSILEIYRPPAATGSVRVKRILVFNSAVTSQRAPYLTANGIASSNISIKSSSDSIVEASARNFANLAMETYTPIETYEISGVIEPLTYNSTLWVNKILPMFPNIYAKSNMIAKRSAEKAALVIGELNSLKECDNIWIEEFIDKSLNKDDIEILNSSKNIFSSSLPNVQYLRRTFDKKVRYTPKIWPYVKPVEFGGLPKDYVLYFCRNDFASEFIKVSSGFNVVLVNARGAYPSNVRALGSYIPYEQLFWIILNAGCVVDLPECNHYMSGLLDLCFIGGIPIVTNNHWMSISKPKQEFVESVYVGDRLIPDFSKLPVAIDNALKMKKKDEFDMSSYNLNLYSLLKNVMGEA
jgi:hypothetical protein